MASSSYKPSILFWLLLGSIACNGLLGGLLISSNPHQQDPQKRQFSERRAKLDHIVRYIPEDQRRSFLQEFRTNRQEAKNNFQEIKHLERKILELASAPELDQQAIETEMSLLRAQRQALSERGDKYLLKLLATLDHNVRLEALEQLNSAPRRNKRSSPHHKRHYKGDGDHDRTNHDDKAMERDNK